MKSARDKFNKIEKKGDNIAHIIGEIDLVLLGMMMLTAGLKDLARDALKNG